MSTSGHSWLIALVLLVAAHASAQPRPVPQASADPLIDGLAEWSDAVQGGQSWPRVPFPASRPRPDDDGLVLRSPTLPLSVHAEPGVSDERTRAALHALESAALVLDRMGWPLPPSDADRGGDGGLDLYLRAATFVDEDAITNAPPLERAAPPRYERAGIDVEATSDIDGAITFAEMSDGFDPALVDACVLTAYADAVLLSMDPAESPQWRRATAVYLSYLVTGRFGCDESLVVRQQRESWRGYVSHDPDTGEAGALLLGAISARHDRETGEFIRDMWNATRQHTPDPDAGLHAAPDVYYVLAHGVALARDPLIRIVEDFAASRWLAGERRPAHALAFPILAALPAAATVEAYAHTSWTELPRSMRFDGALDPYGTAYVICDVRGAPSGAALRVWLRGEFGVEWSMVAIRLGDNGDEIARVRAPPRPTPESYMPVELFDGTADVVIAITNLDARGLDADAPDDFVRGFRVAMDRNESTAPTP